MKLRTVLVTVLAITSTVTFADNRSELTRTLSNGTFAEDKSKSTIIFQSENYSPKNENESTASIKNGIFMYANVLPDYYNEPIRVNDTYDLSYIILLFAKLDVAVAAEQWYERRYPQDQNKDVLRKNFTICQRVQEIQNQIAFYAYNMQVINAHNKVSKVKFDVQEQTRSLNKDIEKMLQPLGNKKCTDIQQDYLKSLNQ